MIQLLTSMRMRIQVAKTMRIHADPDPGQTLMSQKKVDFGFKNILYAGNLSLKITTT
jgi:hypothetical protein